MLPFSAPGGFFLSLPISKAVYWGNRTSLHRYEGCLVERQLGHQLQLCLLSSRNQIVLINCDLRVRMSLLRTQSVPGFSVYRVSTPRGNLHFIFKHTTASSENRSPMNWPLPQYYHSIEGTKRMRQMRLKVPKIVIGIILSVIGSVIGTQHH
jgi:hypothetical protein